MDGASANGEESAHRKLVSESSGLLKELSRTRAESLQVLHHGWYLRLNGLSTVDQLLEVASKIS